MVPKKTSFLPGLPYGSFPNLTKHSSFIWFGYLHRLDRSSSQGSLFRSHDQRKTLVLCGPYSDSLLLQLLQLLLAFAPSLTRPQTAVEELWLLFWRVCWMERSKVSLTWYSTSYLKVRVSVRDLTPTVL